MARSHDMGRRAERLAAALLRRRGWHVLDANYRFHHKEIDLVAERDGIVAFVEVKSRSGGTYGHPLEGITPAKRRDLAAAARGWIARHGRRGQCYRFDAIWVTRTSRGSRIEHVEDAWRV